MLTLNTAHGRGRSPWQTTVRRPSWYHRNVATIAALLRGVRAHVVALQEAELGSHWAGGFDQVAALAQAANYPFHVADAHVLSDDKRYGTALLSRVTISEQGGHAFEHQGRWRKGWSRIRVAAPWGDVSVASVHLDHASPRIRREQVHEILRTSKADPAPQIWMGDFNDTGTRPDGAVAMLLGSLAVATPSQRVTHPGTQRRLDWIFMSSSLRVISTRVLSDPVSDHRAVVADLIHGL